MEMSPTGVLELPNTCLKSSLEFLHIQSGFEVCVGADDAHLGNWL